jgi:phage shock protein PspC (stress-responsive transcriptional regulator)
MTTTPSEPDQPVHPDQSLHTDQPLQPEQPLQPSWGSTPSEPPTGSGTDTPSWGHPGPPQPSGPQQPFGALPGARFFDAVRRLNIQRPDDDRWIAGVAAGLARRWNIHPVAVRLGFALLTLFGGLGVALYGLGWLLLPHPDGRIHAQQVLTGTVTAGFIGALVTLLLGGPIVHGPMLVLAVIAALVWLATGRRRGYRHHYQGC